MSSSLGTGRHYIHNIHEFFLREERRVARKLPRIYRNRQIFYLMLDKHYGYDR